MRKHQCLDRPARFAASLTTALALAAASLTIGGTAASAASTGSCPTATAYPSGTGTSLDPYIIASPENLQHLWETPADWVMNTHFAVTAELDMTASGTICTWDTGLGDSDANRFAGVFDGAGHTISDLNVAVSSAADSFAGLFGVLDTSAVVRNIIFTGDVSASSSSSAFAGGIAGRNYGVIEGAGASGSVVASSSSAAAAAHAGGLVGVSDGSIAQSFARGSATAAADSGSSNAFAGGLVGLQNGSEISYSAADGTASATAAAAAFAGGIAGALDTSTLTQSYTASDVSATGVGSSANGGIAGSNSGSTVAASFWNGDTSSATSTAGAGDSLSASAEKTTVELRTFSTFDNETWDISDGFSLAAIWNICPAVNSGLPYLSRFSPSNACMSLEPTSQTLTAVVNAAITPTTALTADYFSGPVVYSVSPALPAGLSLDPSNGVISGTPSTPHAATDHTVTATSGSETATTTVSITVASQTISPASQTVNGSVNVPITSTAEFVASGFSGTVTYSVSPTLPAGLSISSSTGVISGTPTAASAAATYTVTATHSAQTATATVSIAVAGTEITPATQTLNAFKGVAVTPTEAFTASGFAGTVTYSISPAPPAGLTLSSSTGAISGTPTAVSATATYTITATHSAQTATATVSISVAAQSIAPATQTVTGFVKAPITATQSFTPTGFPSAPTYTVSPSLPAGLAISSSTGVISGTPTAASAAATYTVTATVSALTATATVSIDVAAPTLAPATQSLTGIAGAPLTSAALTPTGFAAAPTYAVSPPLPAGLALNSSNGAVTGTPTTAQSAATYTITATQGAQSATATVSIAVSNPAAPSPPQGVSVLPGDKEIVVTWAAPSEDGGSPIIGYEALTAPGGKTCAVSSPALTCVISGLKNGTKYTVTVRAQNNVGWSSPSAASPGVTPLPSKVTSPARVRATAGNARATVKWASSIAPSGQVILRYVVTSSPGGKTCQTEGKLTCVVSGLENGASYTFTVIAETAQEASVPSDPSKPVTPLAPPGKVRALKAKKVGKGALALSWRPPAGGAKVVGYEYRANSRPWVKTKSLKGVVRGLASNRPARLSVRVLTAAGNGPQTSIRVTPR